MTHPWRAIPCWNQMGSPFANENENGDKAGVLNRAYRMVMKQGEGTILSYRTSSVCSLFTMKVYSF